ncbi:MAG: hypothetical protein Ct9H90mP20_3330 [Candidatus Neomarinimicrobiota bacterium]|nr:MAG: hypothetical protein Ct9H90mP20_3330 [Candidatus Neomarinimicrobiota bacterium]
MKKLANINDVPNKGSKLVFLDETPIALFKINGKIHAWDNRCPHRGASLSDGIYLTQPSNVNIIYGGLILKKNAQ